jgi:hypothetical protein
MRVLVKPPLYRKVPTVSYLQAAFDEVCKEAKTTKGWYVNLMCNESYYGGPEEGGWWGTNTSVVAYQYFSTEEAAQAACEEVKKLAKKLEDDARKAYGRQCLAEMDWLDDRGLDANYLPEPDGPESYHVCISQEIPGASYGPTHYE